MNQLLHTLFFITIAPYSLIFASPVKAQISADGSIPTNVERIDNIFEITGGAEAGGNLFHSFEEFSLPTGSEAFFNNLDTVNNIISRVTGGSISDIDGLIRANGNANLFLINPAGIIFGENASLDIGGSFLGSTANSLVFPEGEFSATDIETSPLLTVNLPIGLGFLESPQKIVNRSRNTSENPLPGIGRSFTGDFFTTGLQVKSGNTLALIGGELILEGGNITANGGRLELGSVGSNSFVSITSQASNLILGYNEVKNFQDISLSPGTIIDTSGEIGGEIKLQGKQIFFSNSTFEAPIFILSDTVGEGKGGSIILNASEAIELKGNFTFVSTFSDGFGTAGDLNFEARQISIKNGSQIISESFFRDGQAGNIAINASELVEVIGTDPFEFVNASIASFGLQPGDNNDSGGGAGNLTINTERLVLKGGGQISTTTFGETQAGNLKITASDIEIIGTSASGLNNGFPSSITAQTEESSGGAGNLIIETERLTVKDGGFISTSTFSSGQGGDLTINASDYIILNGTVTDANLIRGSSGLFALADEFSSGDGGDLSVTTGQLIVENGAKISAETFGSGDAGDVNLDVNQLMVRDGGQIRASSLLGSDDSNLQRGAGGILTINAKEFVEISGTGFISNNPVNSSLFTLAEGTGDAGNLIINTPNLTVKDGGEITAQSLGRGKGGDITFTGEQLTLNNGSITSATASTQGGNITLNIEDNLQFINSGEITASAGTAEAGGDGGNVEINSNFILAFPTDNTYQITAEAFEGDGGSIAIATNSIFGEEFIDFSVSSQFGLDGEIAINTPDVDPVQGLINLPTEVVDPSQLISQSCLADDRETEGKSSEFIVTGRGGLPPSPNQSLKGNATISPEWVAINSLDTENTLSSRLEAKKESPKAKLPKIVQAVGWVRNANGRLTLVAENPYVSASVVNYPGCQ